MQSKNETGMAVAFSLEDLLLSVKDRGTAVCGNEAKRARRSRTASSPDSDHKKCHVGLPSDIFILFCFVFLCVCVWIWDASTDPTGKEKGQRKINGEIDTIWLSFKTWLVFCATSLTCVYCIMACYWCNIVVSRSIMNCFVITIDLFFSVFHDMVYYYLLGIMVVFIMRKNGL